MTTSGIVKFNFNQTTSKLGLTPASITVFTYKVQISWKTTSNLYFLHMDNNDMSKDEQKWVWFRSRDFTC